MGETVYLLFMKSVPIELGRIFPERHNNLIHIPTSRSGKNLSLNIYYQNVRGIRTKLKDLVCGAPLIEYDILVFTETWLINTIYDAELGLTDFDIYRNDRCEITQDSSRGGEYSLQ